MSLINLIEFPILGDERGSLVALEAQKNIPFEIKRVYYIFGADKETPRGFHAHKELQQVAICVAGKCKMILDNGYKREEVWLDSPSKGLLIGNSMWREMHEFSKDCVLMVLASNHYDESDYIRDYNVFINQVRTKLVSFSVEYFNLSKKWLNDPIIKELTMTPDFTEEQQLAFFQSLPNRSDYLIYGIEYTNTPIGACGLKNIQDSSAELWLYIGEKNFHSKKIGPVIMGLLYEVAKNNMLDRLYLKVSNENPRAIYLYEKEGFVNINQYDEYMIMEKKL